MNEWELMTVSEHESERLSEGVRLDLNACTCILKKFSGCVDMDGCGQVRAGREVCWVEH